MAFLGGNNKPLHFCKQGRQRQEQKQMRNVRKGRINISMSPFYSAVVQFIDPCTQAEVVLVGVFHGTSSSAEDVQTATTSSKVNVLVLELCASRFSDLQRQHETQQQRFTRTRVKEEEETKHASKSWAERYTHMVLQTMQQRGVATGLAAALLSGFTGLQSGMSGFTPGLEFVTALHHCDTHPNESSSSMAGTDVILADQDVDETLRKLGDLPFSASEVFVWERLEDGQRQRRNFLSIRDECCLHVVTLQRAIFGSDDTDIPQVHLPSALLRNKSAITDLCRLVLPSTLLIAIVSQTIAVAMGTNDWNGVSAYAVASASTTNAIDMQLLAWIGHSMASLLILGAGTLASIPVVKIILTERDDILTGGLQEGTFSFILIYFSLLLNLSGTLSDSLFSFASLPLQHASGPEKEGESSLC
jgi:hypothetical protein